MLHLRRLMLIAILTVVGIGCGGTSDAGKNKNKDVPKSAEPQPPK